MRAVGGRDPGKTGQVEEIDMDDQRDYAEEAATTTDPATSRRAEIERAIIAMARRYAEACVGFADAATIGEGEKWRNASHRRIAAMRRLMREL